MITINNINRFNNTLEIYGLSTDIKPTETIEFRSTNYKVTNASTFYEMDTKKTVMFDEENFLWHEM